MRTKGRTSKTLNAASQDGLHLVSHCFDLRLYLWISFFFSNLFNGQLILLRRNERLCGMAAGADIVRMSRCPAGLFNRLRRHTATLRLRTTQLARRRHRDVTRPTVSAEKSRQRRRKRRSSATQSGAAQRSRLLFRWRTAPAPFCS